MKNRIELIPGKLYQMSPEGMRRLEGLEYWSVFSKQPVIYVKHSVKYRPAHWILINKTSYEVHSSVLKYLEPL